MSPTLVALAVVALVWGWPIAPSVAAQPAAPAITAPAAIVIDGWSGQVLYAKHPDAIRDPASTVKIMTALVILTHHVPMNRIVTVSPLAVEYGGSTANLYVGEQMTVWNLMHGMLLPSGNDAAVALAQSVAQTPARFAGMMNAEARRLHLTRTHYLTPNGFDTSGQVTTARDLAHLTDVAMHFARFARIVRTKYWHARSVDGRTVHVWQNLNQLLWLSKSVDGVKTGTTSGAGACLVSSVRKNGRWIIAVNMGSTEASRFSDGEALLNYGYQLASPLPSTR